MHELTTRRDFTQKKTELLREKLKDADAIASGKACVYATGSYGRGDAGPHSDLDIFIVGRRNGAPGPDGRQASLLSQLDEICLKADLIETARELGFPEFSDGGRYLFHYSAHEFTMTLGTPEDDVTNTFTARLLLLLESRPLIGADVYKNVTEEVVAAYWRDYADHKADFMPAFLANDILRLWRTFCVNYEARTDRDPADKKAKGKIKNYKLKHSRLLTCYSGILYLLAMYKKHQTVSPMDALSMIALSPTERLQWLANQKELDSAKGTLHSLLDQYEEFLRTTSIGEKALIELFMDKEKGRKLLRAANKFGDLMYAALMAIGENSPFYRMLIV